MPAKSPEPLTKMTLNLRTDDIDFLKVRIGPGFTEEIRDIVHRAVVQRKQFIHHLDKQTPQAEPYLEGDLDDE